MSFTFWHIPSGSPEFLQWQLAAALKLEQKLGLFAGSAWGQGGDSAA